MLQVLSQMGSIYFFQIEHKLSRDFLSVVMAYFTLNLHFSYFLKYI